MSREWITEKFKRYGWTQDTKLSLYGMYDEFKRDTKSTISKDSFGRTIRVIFREYKPEDSIKNYPEEGIHTEESPTEQTITATFDRIKTVDELIEAAHIDLDVWTVTSSHVNVWEMGRKDSKKNIVFSEGRIEEGTIQDDGDISIKQMYQVKITLVKKKPDVAILPPLKQVVISPMNKKSLNVKVNKTGLKTAIVLSDAQMGFIQDKRTGKLFPLHDRRAFSIFLYTLKTYVPDLIVLNGDFFDFADASDKFFQTPSYYGNVQAAFIEFAWWMSEVRRIVPKAKIVFIAGNHEERLKKSMVKYQAYAYGLRPADNYEGYAALSVPNLAAFDSFGIEWKKDYHFSSHWINQGLEVTHGTVVRGKSFQTVKAIIESTNHSVIVGHIHRFEHATRTVHDFNKRKEVEVWAFGAMCRIDGRVPSVGAKENWQTGFGIVRYNDERQHITQVKVESGYAIVDGEVIHGVVDSAQIAKDTTWESLNIEGYKENMDEIYYENA